MTPRERVLRVLLRILACPYRYTKRDLADHFGYSKDSIDEDIQAIKAKTKGENYTGLRKSPHPTFHFCIAIKLVIS